jgi:5-methylcytosine-specific restriction endonuclease McrA
VYLLLFIDMSKKYYQEHKHEQKYMENRRKRQQKWSDRHPFRVLAKRIRLRSKEGSIITASDLWKLAKKQKMRCALTGRKLTKDNISLDHIKHKSKGGADDISNIRFTTYEANCARQCLTDRELVELCKDILSHIQV